MKIINLLRDPFPDSTDPIDELRSISGISLFIFLFLYLLQPFGLSEANESVFWLCLAFGAITFVIGLTYEFLLIFAFKVRKDLPSWTLGKWILHTLGLIVCIAIGNYFLHYYLGFVADFNLSKFGIVIYQTLLVGIFPITFAGLIIYFVHLRKNQHLATQLSSPTPLPIPQKLLVLSSQNQQDDLSLAEEQILYIEAMQNYVAVHFLVEQQIQKELLRTTISTLSEQLSPTNIQRCHRSFIVNTQHISNITGNAQGLKLHLNQLENKTIPVSRKYIPQFRPLLEN